jgi:hypothetical protein
MGHTRINDRTNISHTTYMKSMDIFIITKITFLLHHTFYKIYNPMILFILTILK